MITIHKIKPNFVKRGDVVVIHGSGFGTQQGRVLVDDIEADIYNWTDNIVEIDIPYDVENENVEVKVFDVYNNYATGNITIDFSAYHYCVMSDIRKEMPNVTFTTTSSVNIYAVKKFINEEANYIDSVLSKIYNVPITNEKSIPILCLVNTYFVVSRIIRQMNLSHGEDDRKESWYYDKAMDRLNAYAEKIMFLPGYDEYGGEIVMVDPIFTREDKF